MSSDLFVDSPSGAPVPFSLEGVTDDVTLGELDRRVTRLEADMRDRFRAGDDRYARTLSSLVSKEYYDDRHRALLSRVGDIEAEMEDQRLAREGFHRNLIVVSLGSVLASVGAIIAAVIANIHH